MSWPVWLREMARDFVTACTEADWPGRRAQARRLLAHIERQEKGARAQHVSAPVVGDAPAAPTGRIDKSALPFPPPSGGSPKAARRRERNGVLFWKIRPLVFRRCREWFANRCEFCREGRPDEAHHVLKGSDKVVEESEATMAALCDDCHDKTEAEPHWARVKAFHWARRCAAEARRRGLAELAAAFDRTAELLEGKIALFEAKGIATTTTGGR